MTSTQSSHHLKRIRNVAQAIQDRYAHILPNFILQTPSAGLSGSGQCSDLPWDVDEVFPPPEPLSEDPRLVDIDPTFVSMLSTSYSTTTDVFKIHCESALRKSVSVYQPPYNEDIMSILLQLRRVYHERYLSLLSKWKETAIITCLDKLQKLPNSCYSERQSFKNNSVTLLEKYFEYNAYPSSADRSMLAKHTGLALRQIVIWFQNHRARAKKAGKPIKRLKHNETPPDIDTLEQNPVDSGHSKQASSRRTESPEEKPPIKRLRRCRSQNDDLALQPKRKQYADTFEPPVKPKPIMVQVDTPSRQHTTVLDICLCPQSSTIPQRLDCSIFKTQEKPVFSPPEWRLPLKRARPSHKAVTACDIDNLCDSFATSINIRKSYKRPHEDTPDDDDEGHSWVITRRTVLPPGQHPAVVNHYAASSPNAETTETQAQKYISSRPLKSLPRRAGYTAFLKWQHTKATFTIPSSSNPPPSTPRTPRLHRSPSTSSIESSVACLTPSPSPHISTRNSLFCECNPKQVQQQDEVDPPCTSNLTTTAPLDPIYSQLTAF